MKLMNLGIFESIYQAKKAGAKYRLGPELEVAGYGCEDHFLELDTINHCWDVIAELLMTDLTDGIVCDIGMPVMHKNVIYNCRIIILNRNILLIRPKMILADDGNYREGRWFTPWKKEIEECYLPSTIVEVRGQESTTIGNAIIQAKDVDLACETCEELWAPITPGNAYYLDGVEIIGNGSGSHHELRKLQKRVDLIVNATSRNGGIYLYANQQGCDGGRMYYDGASMIAMNGKLYSIASQFSIKDVEVITGVMDIEEVRSYRSFSKSRCIQAASSTAFPRIKAPLHLLSSSYPFVRPSTPIDAKYLIPEEEVGYGPACWLWDYLRRSGARGFFLPLSGGADSTSVAAIIGIITQLVFKDIKKGREDVLGDLRKVVRDEKFTPTKPQDIANRILFTCYMGTSNSSHETKDRAKRISKDIGNKHYDADINEMVAGIHNTFVKTTGKEPKFESQGGTYSEDLALQNIQARSRMVLSYMLAQLLPWSIGELGFLLVLGSANLDEGLRGYLTKYDCSSADLNPIGSINKTDLKRFLKWASEKFNYPTISEILTAKPTAELRPIGDIPQTDEEDMGMTYDELNSFGKFRKIYRSGVISMFERLVVMWDHLRPREVAEKVKRFFRSYSINRHKMTTITPSYHAENYSTDDNRFDLRQFLYNNDWTYQFDKMEVIVEGMEKIYTELNPDK